MKENAPLVKHRSNNVTRYVKYVVACLLDPTFAANYTKLWLRLCHADNAKKQLYFRTAL